MIGLFAFYLFATVTIASALAVIFARNPVHSVLWLILAFFNAAGLMLIAGAEFIALILVMVYVGAVAVLFLFVVMMLNVDFGALRSGFSRHLPFGVLIALVLLAEIVIAISARQTGTALSGAPPETDLPNIVALGELMYSQFLFHFLLSGAILLVAMIGAIVLTYRGSRGDRRPQDVSRQIGRQPEDAIRMTRPGIGEGVEL